MLNYMRATLSSMEFLKRKAWLLVNLVMRKFFSLQDDDDLVGHADDYYREIIIIIIGMVLLLGHYILMLW